MQTGVQLLAGFLLTLPFSDRFASLDTWQVRLYLGVVAVSALAVGSPWCRSACTGGSSDAASSSASSPPVTCSARW